MWTIGQLYEREEKKLLRIYVRKLPYEPEEQIGSFLPTKVTNYYKKKARFSNTYRGTQNYCCRSVIGATWIFT